MIVVDLGCFPHRHEVSIEPLIERFRPEILYGFDPWPELVEAERRVGGTLVVLERKAAWIEDGEIELAMVHGLRAWDSTVMRDKDSRGEWSGVGSREVTRVPAFDLAAWLLGLPEAAVVKMDVEGAEFPILERVLETGADTKIARLLVEWHDDKMPGYGERRAALEEALRCPVEPWEPGGRGLVRVALGLLPRTRIGAS